MDIIHQIKARLEKYPQISYRETSQSIEVPPEDDSGFIVRLSKDGPRFIVSFDGWHEHFDDEGDTLNCFAFGLSPDCRLDIAYRGRTPVKWTVERRTAEGWGPDSETGLLFTPFWRTRRLEWFQNHFLPSGLTDHPRDAFCTDEELKLIQKIQKAFAGVRLEDGVSLNMAEFEDSGCSCMESEKKARKDERVDWSAIPDKALRECVVIFSYADLKGYRFYLPAYMIWTIRDHRTSESISIDNAVYALDPNHFLFKKGSFPKHFSSEQMDAIIAFLEYVVRHEGISDATVAAENLASIRRELQDTGRKNDRTGT